MPDSELLRPRGKRKTQDPCPGCSLHKSLCICEFIPRLNLRSKISLVVHAKELRRTTNTGSLALKALNNSEMFIRGRINENLDLTSLLREDYRTFLFYPTETALELTTELVQQSPLPIQLIVPDGNWRQASKVHYRHPELESVPRVMIKTPNESRFHLRAETRVEGMATLEAIAEALGVIEGDEVRRELRKLYQKKLYSTLIGRGSVIRDRLP